MTKTGHRRSRVLFLEGTSKEIRLAQAASKAWKVLLAFVKRERICMGDLIEVGHERRQSLLARRFSRWRWRAMQDLGMSKPDMRIDALCCRCSVSQAS